MPSVIAYARPVARVLTAVAGAFAAFTLSAAPAAALTLDATVAASSVDPAVVEEISVTEPATAATTLAEPAAPGVCTPPFLLTPFLPWGDANNYTLAPGGDMEDGAAGWTLSEGAELVDGNNGFVIGDATDRSALRLEPGASALSAPVCIDDTYSSLRFFARRARPSRSDLKVEVLWWKSGATRASTVELHPVAGLLWAPVRPIELPTAHLSTGELEPIQFRFSVGEGGAGWLVDDVYVDPFSRG
jgi:hypothetical protein